MKGVVAAAPQPFVFFSHHRYDSHIIIIPTSQSQISVFKTQHRPTPLICLSSSSSSSSSSSFLSSVVEQQREDSLPLPSPSSVIDSVDDDPDALPVSGCKGCGREQIERGCNGEGRIQGGIATIPGFGWWPIKAYRPCPGFVASGGNYRRRGQSMDEVAFGGGKQRSSTDDFDEFGKRKKGKDRRRGKR